MNKKTRTLDDIFREALKKYENKNFSGSELLCYKILSIDSNNFDTKVLLANISAKKRDFILVKKLLIEALEIKPKNLSVLNNLGTTLKELGETEKAINCFKKTIEINPNNVSANYNLGLFAYEIKDLSKAKSYIEKAISLEKNFALPYLVLGNIFSDNKNYESAIDNYKKAIEINSSLFAAYNNLGLAYRKLGDLKSAVSNYIKAIELKANHLSAHHNLALAYKELGNFKEAIVLHEKLINFESDNLINYFYLSNLKKEILTNDLKNKIKTILENKKVTKINEVFGNYILSMYENKNKNYQKELEYLKKGHENFSQIRQKKLKLELKYCFEDMPQIAIGAKVTKKKNIIKDQLNPIFIIGVPRCGSTLVEKIIGSGKKLIPMGEETSIFENFINRKIMEKKSLDLGDSAIIENELTEIYKKRKLALQEYEYMFTDKSLNNFFYLKIINDIYPSAKIINCSRNPLSSIVSIYKNNLSELSWTHDLDNIFTYFNNYYSIIDNYKKRKLDCFYELEYEKLVNNPEDESKILFKFCGLPWDKKCLDFYKREDLTSQTASNIQIRESIYKHSSKKYSPYKIFLEKYGKKYSWFNKI